MDVAGGKGMRGTIYVGVLAGTLATLLAVAVNVVLSIALRSVVDPSSVFQPLNVGSLTITRMSSGPSPKT